MPNLDQIKAYDVVIPMVQKFTSCTAFKDDQFPVSARLIKQCGSHFQQNTF
jgi:hypothetical protein